MELAHALFLFGPVDALRRTPLDELDDADTRQLLFEDVFAAEVDALDLDGNGRRFHFTLREVLANQLVDATPPDAWATVERLRAQGIPDPVIRSELHLTIGKMVRAALLADRAGQADSDELQEGYLLNLAQLPHTPQGVAIAAVVAELRRPSLDVTRRELVDRIVDAHIDRTGSDADVEQLTEDLDHAIQTLSEAPGPLLTTPDELAIFAPEHLPQVVLTTLVAPLADGSWSIADDLALFQRVATPNLDGSVVARHVAGSGTRSGSGTASVSWDLGPDVAPLGAAVEVRVGADGAIAITRLAAAPPLTGDDVAVVRRAFDDHVDDIAITFEQLAAAVLVDAPEFFRTPHAPLTLLAEAAGLERRGDHLGNHERQWNELRREALLDEVLDPVEPALALRMVPLLATLNTFADDTPPVPDASTYEVLRSAPALHAVVTLLHDRAAEFLGARHDPDEPHLEQFAQLLLDHAEGPAQLAVARWLLARAADRAGDAHAAQAHLELAVETDPAWPPALDHLAGLVADRSEFERARELWRRTGPNSEFNAYQSALTQLPGPPVVDIGRNDPCWCGSGRKFKHCHLGLPPTLALVDRAPILGAKVVSWFMHGSVAGDHDMARTLTDRFARHAGLADALDDIDKLTDEQQTALFDAVVSNPVIVDAIRVEGRALAGFLDHRGPLLPDDERELAEAWLAVPRTVYDVVDLRQTDDDPIIVRDRRTGTELAVADTSPTTEALEPGDVVCARVVPDGRSHRFDGAIIPVRPETVTDLLAELDRGRPETLVDLAAASLRRRLQTEP